MTGCGCLLLVGVIVGLIVFMLFGSTDAGEPVEQIAALALVSGVAGVPLRRALVRIRHA